MSSFIVDPLLPKHEIHLLAGSTGAGKTRWLLETLLAWERGDKVLGYDSYPCPWLYVAADRTAAGTLRTINDLGIDPDTLPLLPAWDLRLSLPAIMSEAHRRGSHLIVIEGFGRFAPERGNSTVIGQFLQQTYSFLKQYDLTIIGVMESPKMKPRDKYSNPRQRISGAAAWGHSTETIFLVEPQEDAHPENPMRWLYVCPRNAPSEKISASLATGHFVIQR